MSASSFKSGFMVSTASVALPLAALALLSGAIAFQAGLMPVGAAQRMASPQTVTIPAGSFEYRQFGEFYRAGYAVDGPRGLQEMKHAVTLMKFQVSTADYDQCVAEAVCPARESKSPSRPDLPVTGVSHDDATIYARWLTEKTGETWRLPSDVELAFAAGSKFSDDALGIDPDSRNPALRWLADYEREAARKASRVPDPQPYGAFGENEHGLSDFGGNVWEWTASCNRRVDIAADAGAARTAETCGIYIASGKHRAPLSSFVRDPKSGGCSVGTPPDNVGFRLVRDTRWYAPLLFAISR